MSSFWGGNLNKIFKNMIFVIILAFIVMFIFRMPETYIDLSTDSYSPKTGDIVNIDVNVVKKSDFGNTIVKIILPNGTEYINTTYGPEPAEINTYFNEKTNDSETIIIWAFKNEDIFNSSINVRVINAENKIIKTDSKTEFFNYISLSSDTLIISTN